MNINLFTDLLFLLRSQQHFLCSSQIVINDSSMYELFPPYNLEKLSKFMDHKSYLICIQINHVLNKACRYEKQLTYLNQILDFLRR